MVPRRHDANAGKRYGYGYYGDTRRKDDARGRIARSALAEAAAGEESHFPDGIPGRTADRAVHADATPPTLN